MTLIHQWAFSKHSKDCCFIPRTRKMLYFIEQKTHSNNQDDRDLYRSCIAIFFAATKANGRQDKKTFFICQIVPARCLISHRKKSYMLGDISLPHEWLWKSNKTHDENLFYTTGGTVHEKQSIVVNLRQVSAQDKNPLRNRLKCTEVGSAMVYIERYEASLEMYLQRIVKLANMRHFVRKFEQLSKKQMTHVPISSANIVR